MKTGKILFSIIIPTFNRATYLRTAIESILIQEYPYFELLIIDDGSTDDTEQYVKSIPDKRIKYFKKSNKERAIARNYGIKKSSGKYITFLDSDDQLFRNHFSEAHTLIIKNNEPEWFHLAYQVKDNDKVLWETSARSGNLNKELITGNHLSCIGVFIRKDIIHTNFFNESYQLIGSEDYELWLRLASRFPIKFSNKITSQINQHSLRSVLNFNSNEIINRINYFIKSVKKDDILMQFLTPHWEKFIAHRYLYLALHLYIGGQNIKSISFLSKAFFKYPPIIVTKKFWATCRLYVFILVT